MDENEVNSWGYQLLNQKKNTEALSVFKLNTALFPQSANTYDSYAETLEMTGNTKGAIVNYKKSVQLNPQNKNAAERIKMLSQN